MQFKLHKRKDWNENAVSEIIGNILILTHAGGDSLDPANTLLLWEVDSVTYSQLLSADANFTEDRWTMGVDWSKHLTGLTYSSSIAVTVYDLDKNSAVW